MSQEEEEEETQGKKPKNRGLHNEWQSRNGRTIQSVKYVGHPGASSSFSILKLTETC